MTNDRHALTTPAECADLQLWAEKAFAPAARDSSAVSCFWFRRQDWGPFNRNQSVLNTPLQIGDRQFTRGLGTHATSEMVLHLAGPGREFTAQVGVDNNRDIAGVHGRVVFVVEAGGQELFRSPVCRGGAAPVPVQVALHGTRRVVLRVLDAGDGVIMFGHADWAEALITLTDGQKVFLDELPDRTVAPGLARQWPFSFVLGGQSSAALLPLWKREEKTEPTADGRELRTITSTDPATGLEVRIEITQFKDFPAIDWVLRFTNRGQADSPILEQVLPLDLSVGTPAGEVLLHHAYGSTAGATDFLPREQPLAPGATLTLAPQGGRSSAGALPFFNLAWAGGGLLWAVGWSGQWSLQARCGVAGALELTAGQQTFRAKLQPGESVRTPRMLLLSWRGENRLRGHNLWRRLLLAHYSPRRNGALVVPPVTQNTWFVYDTGNGTAEENQLPRIRALPALGVEAWWLDAGWFEGGWPNGVGSWVPRADHFPRSLKPLGAEAHRLGLKFLVWFEPERVNSASRIAREHPEFVLGWPHGPRGDGLFNLGDPAARAWLTDHLSHAIRDGGIDIYRTDFNIAPLPFWQATDAPERQGITENHYIEGLYALWDELLRRHPQLVFDNCASGGCRLDLETICRSYALSRSDSVGVKTASAAWDQAQTAGLSLYVPLHATLSTCGLAAWSCQPFSLYGLRSAATSGFGICQDSSAQDFPADLFQRIIAEIKQLRPLCLGDFYPLTSINVQDDAWCAWQFDAPEQGQGFVMFFRRPQSPNPVIEVALHGLAPQTEYEVTFIDETRNQISTGRQLAKLRVEIAAAPGSSLLTYRRR